MSTRPAGRFGVPLARPATAPIAPGAPVPIATPGDPLDQNARARYGRLTNPDLLVGVGEWVEVQSTFLHRIRFVPYAEAEDAPVRSSEQQTGDLYIEFNNGFIGKWEGRSYADYRDYLRAPSKGKHHRSRSWYHGPYETVRGQQYTGAALAARVEANG